MPLEGRHLAVPCAECHLDGQIKATPTRCYDCHWIRRQDDRFRTALGADCEQCHRPISWTAVNWDHGGRDRRPSRRRPLRPRLRHLSHRRQLRGRHAVGLRRLPLRGLSGRG